MINKEKYLKYTIEANEIMDSLQLKNESIIILQNNLKKTELLIPVIGAFSAGKSSVINSFLGKYILPTAITPETALATELRYSSEEYIEAINVNNEVKRYSISEFDYLKDNAKYYKFLRLYIDNNKLREIYPLVLVDMPGFNSPIENHNNAILNYLDKGVHFIFLTSVEDGSITHSMMRELDNLHILNKSFTFGITKTNLKSEEVVQDIKNYISEQLSDEGFYQEIILLDNNSGDNFKKIIKSIDPEKLLSSLYLDLLKENYLSCLESINLRISTLEVNQEELNKTVEQLKIGLNEFINENERMIKELKNKCIHSSSSFNYIADNVTNNLRKEEERLIKLGFNSPDELPKEIERIIQNSLLRELQKEFDRIDNIIITYIQDKLKNTFENKSTIFIDNIDLDRMVSRIEHFIKKDLGTMFDNSLDDEENEIVGSIKYYLKNSIRKLKSIGKWNPKIEIIIKVIDSIELVFDFLGNLFQKDKKERKLKEYIDNIIIKVKEEIREQFSELFNEYVKEKTNAINRQIEVTLQQKRKEIEEAELKKINDSENIESHLNLLKLRKQNLVNVANNYLFSI